MIAVGCFLASEQLFRLHNTGAVWPEIGGGVGQTENNRNKVANRCVTGFRSDFLMVRKASEGLSWECLKSNRRHRATWGAISRRVHSRIRPQRYRIEYHRRCPRPAAPQRALPFSNTTWLCVCGDGPAPLRVQQMTRRWGSCNGRDAIVLNTALVQAPLRCIDYVILHELCHLRYLPHSPQFFRLLRKLMPDRKDRKDKLEASTRVRPDRPGRSEIHAAGDGVPGFVRDA